MRKESRMWSKPRRGGMWITPSERNARNSGQTDTLYSLCTPSGCDIIRRWRGRPSVPLITWHGRTPAPAEYTVHGARYTVHGASPLSKHMALGEVLENMRRNAPNTLPLKMSERGASLRSA